MEIAETSEAEASSPILLMHGGQIRYNGKPAPQDFFGRLIGGFSVKMDFDLSGGQMQISRGDEILLDIKGAQVLRAQMVGGVLWVEWQKGLAFGRQCCP